MTRTRASTLVLVNWKGVFYEHYQLDKHVTALEGPNGAGKTTVLIGCYVVLLPDMSKLRFTNVGETDRTGGEKGVWGRLGEPGRPSYAALELRLPDGNKRLVAGVQLQRRSPPTVDLKQFMITGLNETTKLQDVLLVRGATDAVPEMNELRESVARCGGHLEVFNTQKDYFARLFELGVTPLRLASEEDRTKFNDMLQTSMTGGISRSLTTGLRNFLLKEETGLADTLKRMKDNLEACRRTRIEVEDSRRLEKEISGIYEAGQEMFAAAVHARREGAEELGGKLKEAERALQEVEDEHKTLNDQIEAGKHEQEELKEQLQKAKQHAEATQKALDLLRWARELLVRICEYTRQRDEARTKRDELLVARDQAVANRDRANRAREAAQDAHTQAAQGLANMQQGLEELVRRATEHRMTVRHLANARRLLPEQTIDSADISTAMVIARKSQQKVQEQWLEVGRMLTNAEAHRRDFGEVIAALNHIVNDNVAPAAALSCARTALQDLRELDALAKQQTSFADKIPEVRLSLQRQQKARNLAKNLSTPAKSICSSQDVNHAVAEVESSLQAAVERHNEAKQHIDALQYTIDRGQEVIRDLEHKQTDWREANNLALPLEQRWGVSLRTREAINQFRAAINVKLEEQNNKIATAEAEEKALHTQITQLEQSGGIFSLELLKARDIVEGELLAGRFEELSANDAALYEALLGPLAQAIAVDDVQVAAAELAKSDQRPDSVWLVDANSPLPLDDHGRPPGDLLGCDVLVSEVAGARLTRLPTQPTLGRRARERKIADLRRQETEAKREIESLHTVLRDIQAVVDTADSLQPDADLLQAGDPSTRLKDAQDQLTRDKEAQANHRTNRDAAQGEINTLNPRHKSLRELMQIGLSLDEPDQTTKLEQLQQSLSAAKNAAAEIQRVKRDRTVLDQRLDVLRTPPLSDAEIDTYRQRHQKLERQLDDMDTALRSVEYVQEHVVALGWTDAQAALDEQTALVPALETQLKQAKATLDAAVQTAKDEEANWNTAVEAFNIANADLILKQKTLEQEKEQWRQLGVDDASDEALTVGESEWQNAVADEKAIAEAERKKGEELARLGAQREAVDKRLKEKVSAKDNAYIQWKPAQERWDQLQKSAQEHKVLAATLTPRFIETMMGKGSPNLLTLGHAAAALLKERLKQAEGSQQVLESINKLLGPQDRSGEDYLNAWIQVRDWLRRRIPAQIAEYDEPLEALARLRDNLKGLELRLTKQEGDLRGESEDVAKNIDISINHAQRKVNRLSDDLKLVQFGSIHGIRLRLDRVGHMDSVLRALRDENLLFKADITIEDALEDLFRRHGGRTTSQRLLDYREYVAPKVMIRRQASTEWEEANPMRMSTGEAIGVGAALMMVVLTAWERDAYLLRPRRSQGTLRLLFLDEANRLSQDNLKVLFDLCKNLDLQLMIAAPEVANSEGNTTYRLVRRENAGQEEVIATGRRVVATEQNTNVG
ncbi:MAG: chromosome partition protein MukB [Phycisphaerales bacterium]|nr:chromosome partition protein MukB [Phycisphaerales bacterium]